MFEPFSMIVSLEIVLHFFCLLTVKCFLRSYDEAKSFPTSSLRLTGIGRLPVGRGETPVFIGERSRTVGTRLMLMGFESSEDVLLRCRVVGAPEGEGVRELVDTSLLDFLGERRRLLSSGLERRLDCVSFKGCISSPLTRSPPTGVRGLRGGRRVAATRELT